MFSNREIAALIWLLPLIVWIATLKEVRSGIIRILKQALSPKVAAPFALMSLYTAGEVALLRAINMWNVELLKDTIFWFFGTAIVLLVSHVAAKATGNIFTSALKENLRFVIVFEFILNGYNFPLLVECVLLPFATIALLLHEVAKRDDAHKSAAQVLGVILLIGGGAFGGMAIVEAVLHYEQFGDPQVIRSLALPPLLSILLTPFVFLCSLYCTYELTFVFVEQGGTKSAELMKYTKRRIVRRFGLRLCKLQAFLNKQAGHLVSASQREEIDALLSMQGESVSKTAESTSGCGCHILS